MTMMTQSRANCQQWNIIDDESRMMRISIWMWLALGVIFFFFFS